MNSIFLVFLLFVFAVGCTTGAKKEVVMGFPEAPPVVTDSDAAFIDYPALQRSLLLDRNREDLGFAEKSFNTCQAGYGYSSTKDCRTEHLVVIHFRLLCRDSEGTISTVLTDQDVQALDRRQVRWTLKGLQGSVQTDSDGYGQIVTAARASQKSQRVRLSVGSEFLYMRANEIQKVITPQTWCNQH